jgi:uncharacterized protein with GYD domain
MPTYVSLLRFTEQGIKNIKESPARLDQARKALQVAGGELKAWYLAMGSYDAVVVAEGPTDEAVARVLLQIGATGSIRSETMRVFTELEYRKLLSSLG